MAAIWLSAKDKPVFFSIQGKAFWHRYRAREVSHWPAEESLSNDLLRAIKATQKYAGRVRNRVRDHRSVSQFQIKSRLNQPLGNFQQFDGKWYELRGRQAAVPLVHGFGQGIGYPGAHPDHCRLLDAELHGNRIRSLEPDAANIAGQAIGIFRHDLDRINAIGLVDAHGPGGVDAVAIEVTTFNNDVAEIDPYAQDDLAILSKTTIGIRHSPLQLDGALNGINGTAEFDQYAISSGFKYPAPMVGDEWLQWFRRRAFRALSVAASSISISRL